MGVIDEISVRSRYKINIFEKNYGTFLKNFHQVLFPALHLHPVVCCQLEFSSNQPTMFLLHRLFGLLKFFTIFPFAFIISGVDIQAKFDRINSKFFSSFRRPRKYLQPSFVSYRPRGKSLSYEMKGPNRRQVLTWI